MAVVATLVNCRTGNMLRAVFCGVRRCFAAVAARVNGGCLERQLFY